MKVYLLYSVFKGPANGTIFIGKKLNKYIERTLSQNFLPGLYYICLR